MNTNNVPTNDVNIGSIPEQVNHPSHYNQGEIECIDAMLAAYGKEAVSYFCLLNAFKYLWRCENKSKHQEDLEKAIWYIKKHKEINGGSINE